jgi:hypothetical protein
MKSTKCAKPSTDHGFFPRPLRTYPFVIPMGYVYDPKGIETCI